MNDLLQMILIGVAVLLVAGTAALLITHNQRTDCQVTASTFAVNVTCQAQVADNATAITFDTPSDTAVGWAADNARCVNDKTRFLCTNITGPIELTVSYTTNTTEKTVTGTVR